MYDLLIIGGGPAGAAAGVYAARKRIKSALIAKEWGGQSIVSPDVQNWVGTIALSGPELASMLHEHVKAYADDVLDIEDDTVESLREDGGAFVAATKGGKEHRARTVLICTGSHRRKLPVPGAKEYDNKGISYCASCDAPLFGGKDVAVVGGGNAGFEAASQLLEYAKSVTLFERGEKFAADPVTVEKVLANPNMKAHTNVDVTEITGEALVTHIAYKDEKGKEQKMPIGGIFVEIGALPNSDFVKGLVELNEIGEITVDCKTQRSSKEGVWAAGDVSDVLYKQNNISAGDAVKALEDIYLWLQKNK